MAKRAPSISATPLPSLFFDDRQAGSTIDTLIIHSMHNPDAPDPFLPEACRAALDRYEVSAHYFIDRNGKLWQLVDEAKRAWHAGTSRMPHPDDGRSGVNHFSVGVELFATETSGYTDAQYETLTQLTKSLLSRYPIKNIYGHSDIAPERKTDPWQFDWKRFRTMLQRRKVAVTKIRWPQ